MPKSQPHAFVQGDTYQGLLAAKSDHAEQKYAGSGGLHKIPTRTSHEPPWGVPYGLGMRPHGSTKAVRSIHRRLYDLSTDSSQFR